jgi:hypothetical protein
MGRSRVWGTGYGTSEMGHPIIHRTLIVVGQLYLSTFSARNAQRMGPPARAAQKGRRIIFTAEAWLL